jgi:hypothetical protein
MPAIKHKEYEKHNPYEVTKYFNISPEERNATTSAKAKQSEFTNMLPGKDFR